MKMNTFNQNHFYLESIRDDVKEFCRANWDRWKTEKPDWFTDNFIATIPDDFIPRVDMDRRRNSALGNMLGLPAAVNAREGNASGKKSSKVAAEVNGMGSECEEE
jgi:hypothetical protein